jgi:hypothetical protein
MKDVENVTGRMGESEAVTPAEEVGSSVVAPDGVRPAEDAEADADIGAGDSLRSNGSPVPRRDPGSNPWDALVQLGAQFVSALAAANDRNAPPHPWIERDPTTGTQCLKMPLPPPETARQLADALSALAEGLRGRIA